MKPARDTSYATRAILPNGQAVYLRAIKACDRQALREAFLNLSKDSARNRFYSVKSDLTPAELSYFTEVDFVHHVALVVEIECGSQRFPAGVGRFVRDRGEAEGSEIAMTIADEFQGRGIGKILLNRLIDCARELGLRHLNATMLAQNIGMAKLMRQSRLPMEAKVEEGVRYVSLAL